jgi:hypothetical protein
MRIIKGDDVAASRQRENMAKVFVSEGHVECIFRGKYAENPYADRVRNLLTHGSEDRLLEALKELRGDLRDITFQGEIVWVAIGAIVFRIRDGMPDAALEIARGLKLEKAKVKSAVLEAVIDGPFAIPGAAKVIRIFNEYYGAGITVGDLYTALSKGSAEYTRLLRQG